MRKPNCLKTFFAWVAHVIESAYDEKGFQTRNELSKIIPSIF